MTHYRVYARRPDWLDGGPWITNWDLETLEAARSAVKEAWEWDRAIADEAWGDSFQNSGQFRDFEHMLTTYAYGRGWCETVYHIEAYEPGTLDADEVDTEGTFTRVERYQFGEDGPVLLTPPASAA